MPAIASYITMKTRISVFANRVFTLLVLGIISMFLAPLAAVGQTTVFNDTFAGGGLSTLNPTTTSPGILTGTRTAYEIAASKNVSSGTTTASGVMTFGGLSTGSGYCEGQALFTNSPVTLTAPGQYIEVYYVFTDTTTLFNGNASANEEINIGLYNSGSSGPTNGTALWTGNLSSGSTTADIGCTKGWVGYNGMIAYNAYASTIYNRAAQSAANNSNQGLGAASGATLGGFVTGPSLASQPALTVGSQYTLDLKIYYVSTTSLLITNTLYVGAGTGGSIFTSGATTWQYGGSVTGGNFLTNSFDGLCIGFRPTSSPTTAESMQINKVTVITYIPTAPTITSLTNQTVVQGSNTVLNPTVSGVPTPTYQWQLPDGAGGFTNILGATSASLALNNVQYSQNGYIYSLIASNSVGMVTNSMTLTVIVPPAISGLSDQAVSTGTTASLSPTVTGVPTPTLQWRYNGVNLTDGLTVNGSTITGSTSGSLSIANAQSPDSGTYSLVASNSAGMVTNSMYLTVGSGNVAPIVTGPSNITVIQGNNGTFSATVSGLPVPTLQWLDPTQTPITGANNNTLVLNNVQYSQNGSTYYLVASNSVSSVTNSATLTVIVPPAITSQPVSLVVTNTQSASFTVAATGVPTPTYQWYSNSIPVSGALNNTATNATFTIASVSPASSGSSYYVLISNSAGSTNSATVTLTVNSTMSVAALSPTNGATGICYDTPLYLTFSQTPTLKNSGTIKIFNVTNSTTPVDTIDLSLSVTFNATYAKNVQARSIGGDTFTNFPVIITGNQAAIYPHPGVLTSNQTYYVTLDNGTFADSASANFAGIMATNVWKFTTKVGGPANPTNMLVAADGSGDFATVQGAIDSVASGNTTPTLININNGNYVEIVNVKTKHNLTLRGQSRAGVIIGYANNANIQGSTHYRMAIKINANDIAFDNLTLTNRTPQGGSQAEALMLESNVKRFIFNNCNLGSYQDTLLANGSAQAQAYFNNSLITGQFDYIWGGGVCFFTNCEMRTLYTSGNSTYNLTASRTDTTASSPGVNGPPWAGYNSINASNGFSFVNCSLTRDSGSISKITLADSNGTTNGVSAWINCYMSYAYTNQVNITVTNSQLLWEYGSTNPAGQSISSALGLAVALSAPALTTSDPRYLVASSATNWLYGWQPQLAPNILTNPIGQTVNYGSPATFTVVATGIPDPTYQWQTNGAAIVGATSSTLTIPSAISANAGNYTVIVTTAAGSVTSSVAALVVNPPSNTAPVFTAPTSGANITINVGVSLATNCIATDSDIPAQTLTYALLTGPSSMTINTNSGVLVWRPNVSQAGSVNTVKVSVTDNGIPPLSATNTFTVTVTSLTQPTATTPNYSGGQFSVGVSGQVGPDYALQATTNLAGGTWTTVASTNSPATMPVILTDTNASAQPMQFYRVVTGPPLP